MKKWAKVLIIMASLFLMITVMNITEKAENKAAVSNQAETQQQDNPEGEETAAEDTSENNSPLSHIHIGKTNIFALVLIGGAAAAIRIKEYSNGKQDKTDE